MDTREITARGRTVCPACRKEYVPELGSRDPSRLVQDEFPDATREQREQLVTGMCSTACFFEYVGGFE